MSNPGILDLVAHNDAQRVVVAVNADGSLRLAEPDWPLAFEEIDETSTSDPVTVPASDVEVLETAQQRLDDFNAYLFEVGNNAEEREAWDWDEVSALLEKAAAILPRAAMNINFETEQCSIALDVDDAFYAQILPAAQVIGTHILGSGDADVSDLSAAWEKAKDLAGAVPTP